MLPFKIPLKLVVLDFIGTVLIGVGLAEMFADIGLVPRTMQFPNYDWLMIIFGVILATPYCVHIVKLAIKKSNETNSKQ